MLVVNTGKASIAPALALLTAGLKEQLYENMELYVGIVFSSSMVGCSGLLLVG